MQHVAYTAMPLGKVADTVQMVPVIAEEIHFVIGSDEA